MSPTSGTAPSAASRDGVDPVDPCAAGIDAALDSPHAAHRLARMLLARGDAERAHGVLAACRRSSDALRLLDVACLAALGRAREAHELAARVAAGPHAPTDARLIAAGFAHRAGDDDEAARLLRAGVRDLAEPRTLSALAALAAAAELPGAVASWLHRLAGHEASHVDPFDLEVLQATLSTSCAASAPGAAPEHARTLATELLADERVVDPLVEGLVRLGTRPLLALVRDALAVAGPEMVDQPGRHLADARVALALGDAARSRRLVELGLELAPMHVGLRRLALALEPIEPSEPRRERAA